MEINDIARRKLSKTIKQLFFSLMVLVDDPCLFFFRLGNSWVSFIIVNVTHVNLTSHQDVTALSPTGSPRARVLVLDRRSSSENPAAHTISLVFYGRHTAIHTKRLFHFPRINPPGEFAQNLWPSDA